MPVFRTLMRGRRKDAEMDAMRTDLAAGGEKSDDFRDHTGNWRFFSPL